MLDTASLHQIKQKVPDFRNLDHYYKNVYNYPSVEYQIAQQNFVESMAGYSILSYLLQIKDRHNGNLLIDAEGHLVHIDFGFMLSNSPGLNMNFESSPFKLTQEFIDVMGGVGSDGFSGFFFSFFFFFFFLFFFFFSFFNFFFLFFIFFFHFLFIFIIYFFFIFSFLS